MTPTDHQVRIARLLVARAERDLGTLTQGQRRDLLADNTTWGIDLIAAIVALLA